MQPQGLWLVLLSAPSVITVFYESSISSFFSTYNDANNSHGGSVAVVHRDHVLVSPSKGGQY